MPSQLLNLGVMPRLLNRKAVLLADQAIFSGSSFLVTILLARILPVHEFGTYAGVVLVLYLAVSVISAFVIQPLQVTLPSVRRPQDYLAFSLWAQFITTLVLVVLVSLVLMLPFEAFGPYAALLQPILIFAFGFLMQDYFRKRLLAADQIEQTLLADVLLMGAHFGALMVLATHTEPTLGTAITLLGFGYAVPLSVILVKAVTKDRPNAHWRVYAKMHVNQGKWLFYTAVVQWWAGNFFVVASGFLLGAVALGALRLVQTVFGVLNILFQTFENYVLPQTAGKMQVSMQSGIVFLKKTSRQSILFVAVLLSVLFLFSDFVIVLAGGEAYRNYGFLVKGMSVLYVFIFAGYPVRIAIRALIMNKIFFEGYVLTFAFGLLSFWLLLTRFELAGAIAGLILSQIILLVYWQIQLAKKNILLWK
jgi:O-antigen/teichoic acid export membrane protein